MNVGKQWTVSLPTNCWVIKLLYTKTLVSPTIRAGFTISTIGGEHEISQIVTSQFSPELRSTGCARLNVKAESLFSL